MSYKVTAKENFDSMWVKFVDDMGGPEAEPDLRRGIQADRGAEARPLSSPGWPWADK